MWQQNDLLYETVKRDHQARIDAAARSNRARLAREAREPRPGGWLFAALRRHRSRPDWTGLREAATPRVTAEDQVATA